MDYGENFLILYNNTNNHKQIFQNFMRQMAGNDSILFYVSHKTNQLSFNFGHRKNLKTFSFNIINEEVIHELKTELEKCFKDMEKNNKNMYLISDWSNVNLHENEIFIPFMESLIKHSQGLNPPRWRRRYKGMRQKIPFTLINAFQAVNHRDDFIQQLMALHDRVYLLQENLNTFLLPTLSPSSGNIFPKFHVLPSEVLEKLVKNNLELVSLILIEKGDKSGYQILKDIAQHFHCILSQGTLYPLLYQLERKGKIMKQNGKGREVVYSLSQRTKKDLELRKDTCLKSYQHLASFFE